MKDFSKATPRPWQRNDRGYIRSSEEVPICRMFSDAYFMNYEANAELIVTAVNNYDKMKEALTMSYLLLNEVNQPVASTPHRDELLKDIKSLLESLNK